MTLTESMQATAAISEAIGYLEGLGFSGDRTQRRQMRACLRRAASKLETLRAQFQEEMRRQVRTPPVNTNQLTEGE